MRHALNFITVSHVDSVLQAALNLNVVPAEQTPAEVPQEAALAIAHEQKKKRKTGIRQ